MSFKRARDDDGDQRPTDIPDYASAVKTGKRSSQSFKTAWHLYCESQNTHFFDPVRHGENFVQGFFEQLGLGYIHMRQTMTGNNLNSNNLNTLNNNSSINAGNSGGMGLGPAAQGLGKGGNSYNNNHNGGGGHGGGGMSMNNGSFGNHRPGKGTAGNSAGVAPDTPARKIQELVKMGQRNCSDWKQLWIEWCQNHGNSVQDPARHSPLFILSFVLKFGLASVVGTQWAQSYLVSLGELAKPYMTHTINRGIQESDHWSELWSAFADGKGSNLRDPSKHDAGSLMEFFDMTAYLQFSDSPWMQCYMTGDESLWRSNGGSKQIM